MTNRKLSNIVTAGLFCFVLVVSGVVLTTQFDEQVTSVPENFRLRDLTPQTPIQRNFPDVEFPAANPKLQLGIYNRLKGAETQQSELTGLGVLTHIEKRAHGESFRYAVVIEYTDAEDHERVLATLDSLRVRYFHLSS